MFSNAVPILEITVLPGALNVLLCIFGKKKNRSDGGFFLIK